MNGDGGLREQPSFSVYRVVSIGMTRCASRDALLCRSYQNIYA